MSVKLVYIDPEMLRSNLASTSINDIALCAFITLHQITSGNEEQQKLLLQLRLQAKHTPPKLRM